MKTLIRYLPDGSVRTIYDEVFDPPSIPSSVIPRRASRVEVIEEGPCRGLFFVDMSPLGPAYQFCLWPPCRGYKEAVATEVAWLKTYWLKG